MTRQERKADVVEGGFRMKVKVLEKTEREMRFEVSETTPAFANTLRRILMNNIPVLAIDTVDFINNTSALYDELLAHRLGLVPMVFDPKNYAKPEDCKCKGKGCSGCQAKFVLKKEGPCTVYAKDLKCTDDSVRPLDGDIILVKLLEHQELELEATAILGTGQEHAKYQTAIIGYNYHPSLKVDKKNIKDKDAVVGACPSGMITKDLKLKDEKSCKLCGPCSEQYSDVLTIEGDSTRIIFNIESVCGLSAEELVKQAITKIKDNVGEFEQQASKALK